MKQDLELLSKELAKCFTPVSGKNVVSLFETERGVYLGHNVEIPQPLWFLHAEEMTIAKMLDTESTPKIKRIVTWGSESADSLKNITMCFDCFQKASSFMDNETKIEIINPDITKGSIELNLKDFQIAYEFQSLSKISGNTHSEIVADLKAKTPLINSDVDFIADLRLLGLEKKINFLLIGSASGKGGTSRVIFNKIFKPYHDIDLLAVTSIDSDTVTQYVLEIIKKYYKSCILTTKECPVPSQYKTRLKRKFTCQTKEGDSRLIELDIGVKIEDIVHKPEYISRNWFQYLS